MVNRTAATLILIHEFPSSDEEMKKIVLKVVKQCTATEGVLDFRESPLMDSILYYII